MSGTSVISTTLLILSIVAVTVQSRKLPPDLIKKWEESIVPFSDDCINKTQIDPNIPKLMFRDVHLPDEETFHCYWRCVYGAAEIQRPDGSFDLDRMVKLIPLLTRERGQKCIDGAAGESEMCKKSYKVVECVVFGALE